MGVPFVSMTYPVKQSIYLCLFITDNGHILLFYFDYFFSLIKVTRTNGNNKNRESGADAIGVASVVVVVGVAIDVHVEEVGRVPNIGAHIRM